MNDPRFITTDALPDRFTDPPLDIRTALSRVIEINDTKIRSAAAIAGTGVEDLLELTFDRLNQFINFRTGGSSYPLPRIRSNRLAAFPLSQEERYGIGPYSLSSRPTRESSKLAPMYLKCGRTAMAT